MDDRRRRLLGTMGTALALGLAGCSAQNGSDGTTDQTTTGETTDETTETTEETTQETTEGTTTTTAEGTTTTTTAEVTTEAGADPPPTVAVTLDNVGARAWEVTSTADDGVAPTGENNPTLSLSVGTRYAIDNEGWSFHPLAFRAADDTPLLSQSAPGQYEDDADVDWVDDDETLAFTLTEDLAADLDYYICTVHASMRGDVTTA